MLRKAALVLCQIFIIIALLDGLADIGFPVMRTLADRILWWRAEPAAPTPPEQEAVLRQAADLAQLIHPGGRRTIRPPVPEVFALGPDGFRASPGDDRGAPVRGAVGGSSVAFGFATNAPQSLPAQLGQLLPRTSIRNLALPGQTIVSNMQDLRGVLDGPERPDFVVMVAGWLDLVSYCQGWQSATDPGRDTPVLLQALLRLSKGGARGHCQDEGNAEFLVNRLLYDMEGAQSFAAARHVRLAVILPPFPHRRDPAAAPTPVLPYQALSEQLIGPLLPLLRQRLAQAPTLRAVDLSDDFLDHGEYFADSYGHFSAAGNAALARLIVERLGAQFFTAAQTSPPPG